MYRANLLCGITAISKTRFSQILVNCIMLHKIWLLHIAKDLAMFSKKSKHIKVLKSSKEVYWGIKLC